jgi:class 3 adenylate cyclase
MLTEIAPTGTFTFLFNDIEGSTRLSELYPEAMKNVLARHDALLRQAVGAHHGCIVMTTGDGCHAVFESAAGAVASALAAQQALQAELWTEIRPEVLCVRMGVHTGEAEARAGCHSSSTGTRAVRVMVIGYSGQAAPGGEP